MKTILSIAKRIRMEFKHIEDAQKKFCDCITWLQHWRRNNNTRVRPECSVYFCSNKATMGGIVVNCDKEEEMYVTPVCPKHYPYSYIDHFQIKKRFIKLMVSVKELEGCGCQ
jgi:hypothetical protein